MMVPRFCSDTHNSRLASSMCTYYNPMDECSSRCMLFARRRVAADVDSTCGADLLFRASNVDDGPTTTTSAQSDYKMGGPYSLALKRPKACYVTLHSRIADARLFLRLRC